MGKSSNIFKLSKSEQEALFVRFSKALGTLKSPIEAANFIRDLLSEQEVMMFARRLQIADLLQGGNTYAQIKKAIKVGDNTIAKVQFWLNQYGEGYRAVLSRQPKQEYSEFADQLSWKSLKKRYPMYFWPELVLKEIVANSNKKERQKLLKVVNSLKEKSKLSKDLLKLLKN